MKFLIFITLLFLTSNINARENPFTSTNSYVEETERIAELNEAAVDSISEAAYIKEMQQKMNQNKKTIHKKELVPSIKKTKEKVYTKKEVDKLISKTKKQTAYKTKQIIKKELQNNNTKPVQVVYVKPRTDIISESDISSINNKITILPFIEINYDDNRLVIDTSSKILKKFTLEDENKIIIDYKGKKSFYTKRKFLQSTNFKKITVGNHKSKNFYRVVIKLNSTPTNFLINYKNNLVTITRTN